MFDFFSLSFASLLIWVFAMEFICGFIIALAKIRPTWFRLSLAVTYAVLPSTISILAKSISIGFIAILLELIVLFGLLLRKSAEEKMLIKEKKFSLPKKLS